MESQTIQHESESEVSVSIYKSASGKTNYSVKVPVRVPRLGEKSIRECVDEAYGICLEYWHKLEDELG